MVDIHQQVTIKAPCRIHLGLLSVHQNEGRRFGGAGVMLDKPALELSAQHAPSDTCSGPLAERAMRFVASWRKHTRINGSVGIRIKQAPPQHVGLGLGTQLGMSVATVLDCLYGRKNVSLAERAGSVGRGLRSAVGAYGFRQGGLIVECGKRNDEQLGQLEQQIDLPPAWHVMLVRMKHTQGLAGKAEIEAFRTLSDAAIQPQAESLREVLFSDLVPAAIAGDFDRFSDSVFRYGLYAGEMFAQSQGGPFLNDSIAKFVDYCRTHGVRGVGQSSWGPTVYCWFPSKAAAEAFRSNHVMGKPNLDADVTVTAVSSCGAELALSTNEG